MCRQGKRASAAGARDMIEAMHLYLPVANISVNALVIILLGGGVGFLSGMFGVGGGFLTTPLLIIRSSSTHPRASGAIWMK